MGLYNLQAPAQCCGMHAQQDGDEQRPLWCHSKHKCANCTGLGLAMHALEAMQHAESGVE